MQRYTVFEAPGGYCVGHYASRTWWILAGPFRHRDAADRALEEVTP